MFLFSSNYGEMDSLCDMGYEDNATLRWVALAVPLTMAVMAVLILLHDDPAHMILRLTYTAELVFLAMASYFDLKYLIMRDIVGCILHGVRGFSSGLMHGICTGMVGLCLTYIRKKKRLFYCGIFATFGLAVVYHSLFDSLVQADATCLNYIGFAMPMTAYIPIVIRSHKQRKLLEKGQTS